MQILLGVSNSNLGGGARLTRDTDSSTSTSYCKSTSGTGDWSRRSSTSATLHSKSSGPCVSTTYTNVFYSDPFIHMERSNKTYGFTIAVKELRETVPNIFRYAAAYKRTYNVTTQGLWEMFLEPKPEQKPEELPKDDPKYQKPLPEEISRTEPGSGQITEVDPEAMEGESYNMCHFWSNFEIARLDWFRSKEYEDFFNMMDRSGGFWMERVSHCQSSCETTHTDGPTVGRRSHPFSRRWYPPRTRRRPLLPRLWVSPYNHPALSRQCADSPDGPTAVLRGYNTG